MKFTSTLLRIVTQLRMYHWYSDTYAQHKAYGKAYDTLSELIDTFTEVYMGRYGKINNNITFNIELHSDLATSTDFISSAINFLTKINEMVGENDTDLLNIRDEMIAVLNRLKYLLMLS